MTKPSVRLEPKTRFPVIRVPGTNYGLSWLPVTKIQIEHFLCETMDSQFDRSWYLDRLKRNERVAPEQVTSGTLQRAFMTDLLLPEVQTLCKWWDSRCDLPTLAQWRYALEQFDTYTDENFVAEVANMPDLHPRAKLLLPRVAEAVKKSLATSTHKVTLSHHLLLRSGILEYVYPDEEHHNSCLACGSKYRYSTRERSFEDGFISQLANAEIGERRPDLGFRLLFRTQE